VGPTFCNFVGGSAEAEAGVFLIGDVAGRFVGTMTTDFACVFVGVEDVDATGVGAWTNIGRGVGLGRLGECEYKQF